MGERLNALLFLCAAAVMVIALVRAITFTPRVRPRRSRRLWIGLTALVATFLVAYVAATLLTLLGLYQRLAGLTSAVFLGGAGFVLLTIYLTTRLNADLARAGRRQEDLIEELEVKNAALESAEGLGDRLAELRAELGEGYQRLKESMRS